MPEETETLDTSGGSTRVLFLGNEATAGQHQTDAPVHFLTGTIRAEVVERAPVPGARGSLGQPRLDDETMTRRVPAQSRPCLRQRAGE